MASNFPKSKKRNNMKRIFILAAAALTCLAAQGCKEDPLKQFGDPADAAKVITTTSFRPQEGNPSECGEPYDDNDLYPNVTEYQDKYGNSLLKKWFHPGGEVYIYARFHYGNPSAGILDKVVKYVPGQEPREVLFVHDSTGAVVEISDSMALPDMVYIKTEKKKEQLKTTETQDDRTVVSEMRPLDDGKVQESYTMVRTDSVSESGSRLYDRSSGNLMQHSGTRFENNVKKLEFGKKYEYTADGKIASLVNHEGAVTGYYFWEYDSLGNWTSYRYYRDPDDGKGEYSQQKEYTYNADGEWIRCVTTTCGVPEAIVIREITKIE